MGFQPSTVPTSKRRFGQLMSARFFFPEVDHRFAPKIVAKTSAGKFSGLGIPRHPVIFSDDDWDVQSPPQQSI